MRGVGGQGGAPVDLVETVVEIRLIGPGLGGTQEAVRDLHGRRNHDGPDERPDSSEVERIEAMATLAQEERFVRPNDLYRQRFGDCRRRLFLGITPDCSSRPSWIRTRSARKSFPCRARNSGRPRDAGPSREGTGGRNQPDRPCGGSPSRRAPAVVHSCAVSSGESFSTLTWCGCRRCIDTTVKRYPSSSN